MSNFSVTILGCGSAKPSLKHMPSAQAISYNGRVMLVDCGEGTQVQLSRYSIPFGKITDIFISHLHGDHFLGLPGLLATIALHSIEGVITLHITQEGADLIRTIMKVVCPTTTYQLHYNIIRPGECQTLVDAKTFTVEAFPLKHRVPCSGFIFREKPKQRHLNGELAKFYKVPHYLMNDLRDGADLVLPDGRIIDNKILTTDPTPAYSYAYCSDTEFVPALAEVLDGVSTIYHEATYGDDSEHKARSRGHSTARQAATIADKAHAKRLVIGHYSRSITNEEAIADEARQIFPNTIAAKEGLVIDIDKYPEES